MISQRSSRDNGNSGEIFDGAIMVDGQGKGGFKILCPSSVGQVVYQKTMVSAGSPHVA
jgi:hypothetical protein